MSSVISRSFTHCYIVLRTHTFVHLHSNHAAERRRLALILLASSSSSCSQQEVIELEQHTCRKRERKCKTITDCHFPFLLQLQPFFSSNSATQTQQSGFVLNKEVGSFHALTTASCCCHSLSLQPFPALTHAHRHIRAGSSLYKHPHMTPVGRHTVADARARAHTQARELESMGSRVTPAPCFIKGAVTIGLLLL